MKKEIKLTLRPEQGFDDNQILASVLRKLKKNNPEEVAVRIIKRSIDARSKNVKINLLIEAHVGETPSLLIEYVRDYPNVTQAKVVVVVGSGPAGLFAH